MPHTVSVRDVVNKARVELPPDELVLRVPYDLFAPTGAVQMLGEVAAWTEGGVEKTGRVVSARLGETHPGERVLLHLSSEKDDEWWLCEVEAVDDEEATP